jgi:hypothetical protein
MADHISSLIRTVLTVLALSLLTACTDRVQGTPLAGSAAPTSSTPDRNGAPVVSSPIDASRFVAQPCAALTSAQLQTLNLPGPGVPDTNSSVANYSGPSCSWRNSEALSSAGVSFLTGTKNGLADIYRGHAQGQFPGYWVETTVDDYPGVFAGLVDARKDGTCELGVGISDTLVVLVDRHDQTGEKSCDQAKVAASMALKTIRGG